MSVPYLDLHSMAEDDRITAIGQAALAGNRVGVMLEKDEPEKVARYIRKVGERFPGVALLDVTNGPTALVVTLRFGLAERA